MISLKKILLVIISWTWCLPQTLCGALLLLYLKITHKVDKPEYLENIKFRKWTLGGGISLGNFVFVEGKNMVRHEHGHSLQSYILGWLYLLIIGLPSIIWCNCYSEWRDKYNKSYYWFYTESWANKLGKVKE